MGNISGHRSIREYRAARYWKAPGMKPAGPAAGPASLTGGLILAMIALYATPVLPFEHPARRKFAMQLDVFARAARKGHATR